MLLHDEELGESVDIDVSSESSTSEELPRTRWRDLDRMTRKAKDEAELHRPWMTSYAKSGPPLKTMASSKGLLKAGAVPGRPLQDSEEEGSVCEAA